MKFLRFKDKLAVLEKAKCLKGSFVFINEDFSDAVRQRRNVLGITSSTCIDHIFINTAEYCSKAVSVALGYRDHNLVALTRKTKIPKAGPKVIYLRS